MNTMPKGFYTGIRRRLQADTEALAAAGICVEPEEIASEFRNRSAKLQHMIWLDRLRKAVAIVRIWLGVSGLLLLLGSVGGISRGTTAPGTGFVLALLGMALFFFATSWRRWRV